jgi:hypothetical protein
MPVIALPLAADFRVDGAPMQLTTADLSLGGAAFVYTRYVDAPYLAIDFTSPGIELLQVVYRVLACRSVGPVYAIRGEFVSRLS